MIRDLLARVAANGELRESIDADTRVAARSLGWIDARGRDAPIVTDAGARLLATDVGSTDELAIFAAAVLEHPPFCSIVGALLLGEWLDLRDLAPALVRTLGLPPAQAARLVPCVLAWRNELRAAGWTARQAALHLRSLTAWMTGLSVRTRDVLARIGVVTPERLLALDLAPLRERQEFKPDTIREIERFREELGGTETPERAPTLVEEQSVLLRKLGSFELSSRARRVLRDVGAVCIADVVALDPEALLRQPQCGRSTVEEIVRLVHGLGLRMTVREEAPPPRAAESAVDPVLARARRLAARRGCVSIGALARECADLPEPAHDLDALRRVLDADADVRWIDDDRAWFWIASARGAGLLARVDELMRGGGPVSATDLRRELLSEAGARADVPPASVLGALCEQLGHAERLRCDPVTVDVVQPAANAPTPPPSATIDGNSSVADLAAAAGLTVDELVALAISDAGRETGTGRGGRNSRR